MKPKNGFTLIELLVVIAIIALLLSIVMPSLKSARDQARRIVCATKLKQLSVATEAYHMQNNYKRFVLRRADDTRFWMVQLAPYIGDDRGTAGNVSEVLEAIMCPSAPLGNFVEDAALISPVHERYFGRFDRPFRYANSGDFGDIGFIFGTYGINQWWTVDERSQADRNASLNAPEAFPDWNRLSPNVPLFADCSWPMANPRQPLTIIPTLGELRHDARRGTYEAAHMSLWRFAMDRHRMRVNVLFKDGTVNPVELKHLGDIRWTNNWVNIPEINYPRN